MFRVGIGYDVHPFAEGRPLVLGGVTIAHHRGLDGHSDADVLVHAIADALLGALGEPDIGYFFPNTDPQWKNAASTEFLKVIAEKIRDADKTITNIDASLVAEEPRVLPHLTAMKTCLADSLGIETGQIGIKATTNEKMGFVGRGEGIAAMAVAGLMD